MGSEWNKKEYEKYTSGVLILLNWTMGSEPI